MLVRDIMHSPVITTHQGESLATAYRKLQEHGIRHLPVLDGDLLVGVVTDRDLRLATSALQPHPFPNEARVEQVMTRNPITTTPLDPVEEAARRMQERKIGCLPVMEGARLSGIITGPDLLDAIVRLTGLMQPSGRLAVQLSGKPGQLARLTALLDSRGVEIHSVLSYPEAGEAPRVILRVSTLNTHLLADFLREEGFQVVWPIRKSWIV